MHLIELIAQLEAVKAARGNVPLADVVVMAAGDFAPLADFYHRKTAAIAPPQATIDITGMSEDQIDELRAENPGAKFVESRTVAANREQEQAMNLPDLEGKSSEIEMPCPQFDEHKVGCILPFGHEQDHQFATPSPADLANIMEEAAAKLPAGANAQDIPARKPNPCDSWDGKGHQCVLPAGHENDHLFLHSVDIIEAGKAQSSPGDAGLPDKLQE